MAFQQAKSAIEKSLKPVFDRDPLLIKVFEILAEPDHVLRWKAVWCDDNGEYHINTCWRVQQNGILGPYKGGLRFDPSVNLDILRFLALEQVLKNSLTGLQIGGAKGGSDFNPKGKSDNELRKFCEAFMLGLHQNIGPSFDVPAGDIGVGGKLIGYLYGAWRRLGHEHSGVLTGKGLDYGGSLVRAEATGFGLAYITEEYLKHNKDGCLKGKHILISGAGNVATYACKKCVELGAIVHSLSDRKYTYWCDKGFTDDLINNVIAYKHSGAQLSKEIVRLDGSRPWGKMMDTEIDIALPCATQNEVEAEDVQNLLSRGVHYLLEGSNMSSTAGAVNEMESNSMYYCEGKLSNLGGVGTSYFEMEQNARKEPSSYREVDEKLKLLMRNAFQVAANAAKEYNVSLADGANIASFLKVAKNMKELGYVTFK